MCVCVDGVLCPVVCVCVDGVLCSVVFACIFPQTDPKNTDYVPEHGAVRTFQAERVAEKMAENERKEKEEEEANDPMLVCVVVVW